MATFLTRKQSHKTNLTLPSNVVVLLELDANLPSLKQTIIQLNFNSTETHIPTHVATTQRIIRNRKSTFSEGHNGQVVKLI